MAAITKMSKLNQTIIAIATLESTQRFFENPENQKEFEIWKQNRDAKKYKRVS